MADLNPADFWSIGYWTRIWSLAVTYDRPPPRDPPSLHATETQRLDALTVHQLATLWRRQGEPGPQRERIEEALIRRARVLWPSFFYGMKVGDMLHLNHDMTVRMIAADVYHVDIDPEPQAERNARRDVERGREAFFWQEPSAHRSGQPKVERAPGPRKLIFKSK